MKVLPIFLIAILSVTDHSNDFDIVGKWSGSAEFSIHASSLNIDREVSVDFIINFEDNGTFSIYAKDFTDRLFLSIAKEKYKLNSTSYQLVQNGDKYVLNLSITANNEQEMSSHNLEVINKQNIVLNILEDDGDIFELFLLKTE